ncbi:hypothetical protein AX15_000025 [Amanita polypyramis BW_CC]|nr:hypothetical protein AX15_000025 [Amanita polypyramis BW_CC]
MSDKYYHSLQSVPSEPQNHIETALKYRPTILFFHGNAATRAAKPRVRYYRAFTARLGVNVLAIDYRGFADSTGTPTEAGLVRDGRAAFDWLLSNGAKPEDILIMGHSLGTGVSSQLITQLDAEELPCRGLVLLSPFSSIKELLNSYHILGILPLFKGISAIPGAMNVISWALVHKFDTLNKVPDIKSPVLIAHAENDWEIPDTHSDALFQAFLEPLVPNIPISQKPLSLTTEEWSDLLQKQEERSRRRREIVETSVIPNFGEVSHIQVGRPVTLVKTLVGGHNGIAEQEGLQDVIAKEFGLL